MFPDALPASAKEGDGIVQLTEVVRDQMLGRTMKASISVPLSDPKGITFIEKFSDVVDRDYESTSGSVKLSVEMSQRIMDQLPNNVPSAKVLKVAAIKAPRGATSGGGGWRIKTKPIKDLIPEGMLEGRQSDQRAEALGVPTADGVRVKGAGLSIGNRKLVG